MFSQEEQFAANPFPQADRSSEDIEEINTYPNRACSVGDRVREIMRENPAVTVEECGHRLQPYHFTLPDSKIDRPWDCRTCEIAQARRDQEVLTSLLVHANQREAALRREQEEEHEAERKRQEEAEKERREKEQSEWARFRASAPPTFVPEGKEEPVNAYDPFNSRGTRKNHAGDEQSHRARPRPPRRRRRHSEIEDPPLGASQGQSQPDSFQERGHFYYQSSDSGGQSPPGMSLEDSVAAAAAIAQEAGFAGLEDVDFAAQIEAMKNMELLNQHRQEQQSVEDGAGDEPIGPPSLAAGETDEAMSDVMARMARMEELRHGRPARGRRGRGR